MLHRRGNEGKPFPPPATTRATRAVRVKRSAFLTRTNTARFGLFHSRLSFSMLSTCSRPEQYHPTTTIMADFQSQTTAIAPQAPDEVTITDWSASTNAIRNGAVQGHPVVRSPEDLHLHPALLELDGMDVAGELNEAERVRHHATTPILITSDGTVLSGFGRWRSALLHGEREIPCIEYALGEEDSLQFILNCHKPKRGWNSFVRTRLALTQEPYLRRKAIDNMRAGGRHKGSAKLPTPQHIDVRCQTAEIAGVGVRNVSNVKTILEAAHPRLLTALVNGTLTINKAVLLCKLPRADQPEAFTKLLEDRAADKVIRATLSQRKEKEPNLDVASVLSAFQACESRNPGSVVVRRGRSGRITISVSNELLDKIDPQTELQLHETAKSTQRPTDPDPPSLGPE